MNTKDNIIQFIPKPKPQTERTVEDGDLGDEMIWSCTCGSVDFWLYQVGDVRCAECDSLVELGIVFEGEDDE